jgi:prephenate dehydratase
MSEDDYRRLHFVAAFQGVAGAFGEEAVRKRYGPGATPLACATFSGVRDAVIEGRAHVGFLPIANSIVGPVECGLRALQDGGLSRVATVRVKVELCLMGVVGRDADEIRLVLSHPVALAQCGRFFGNRPELRAESFFDTAGAAREVALRGDPTVAAIASRRAARYHGLAVVHAGVQDRRENRTTFAVVAAAVKPDSRPAAAT